MNDRLLLCVIGMAVCVVGFFVLEMIEKKHKRAGKIDAELQMMTADYCKVYEIISKSNLYDIPSYNLQNEHINQFKALYKNSILHSVQCGEFVSMLQEHLNERFEMNIIHNKD